MDTNETTIEEAIYSVPGRNLPTLLERIEKLNKRCRKLGITEIAVDTAVEYTAHRFKHTGHGGKRWVKPGELEKAREEAAKAREWNQVHYRETGVVMDWHTVRVQGTAPKYAGWKFIATLEPLPTDDGTTLNLVMTVPGETCPTTYMRPEAVGVCDHCKAKRRRKQTFVVRHDDGRTLAVGRNCIKDFLGHADPQRLATWAEILMELGRLGGESEDLEWSHGGSYGEPTYDAEYYLGWVAGVMRCYGWTSKTVAMQEDNTLQSTASRVDFILNPPSFTGKYAAERRAEWEAERAKCTPTEEDKAKAAAALEWAKGLDLDALMEQDGESYLANVAAVARASKVTRRTAGLVASIVQAADRAAGKAAQRAARAARPASLHMGELKARGTYRVRVDKIIPRESVYGVTLITRLAAWDDARGDYLNDMVWFCTGELGMVEGNAYEVKATVKAHEEYNGRPQTVVNRVKVQEKLGAAA